MNKKLKSIAPHLAVIIALALILLCVLSYVKRVNSVYNTNLLEIMGKYSSEKTAAVTKVMKNAQDAVYYCAVRVAAIDDKTDINRIEAILAEQQSRGVIDFFAYGDKTNTVYASDGKEHYIDNPELVSKMNFGTVYTGTAQNGFSGLGRCIVIGVPVYDEKEICGYIYAEYSSEKFADEVNKIADENIVYSVVTEDGTYVLQYYKSKLVSDDVENGFDILSDKHLESEYTEEWLSDIMKSGSSAVLRAEFNGVKYCINYTPLGINNWYLVTAPEYTQINYQASYINRNIILLVAEMFIIGALYYAVTFIIYRHQHRQIEEENKNISDIIQCVQGGVFSFSADSAAEFIYISKSFCDYMGFAKSKLLQNTKNSFYNLVNPHDCEQVIASISRAVAVGEVSETRYRVLKADGTTAWLYQRAKATKMGGKDVVYAVVTDITENQNMKAELTESKETFDFLLENMNNITFEWNAATNKITVSKLWTIKMGYRFPENFANSAVTMKNVIYARDLRKFVNTFNSLSGGKHYVEEIVRLRRAGGSFVWCRLCMSGMRYRNQRPTVITGVIVDIDKTRREMEHMQALAEKDSMTGLYNKTATQHMISNCIRKSKAGARHAFMMIDLDNFKMVNDRFGHAYGDAAITKLSHLIKSIFRTTDIMGRIGGDEFVVFLKDIESNEIIEEKADALCRGMHEIEVCPGSGYMLSVTVGIAFYDTDGESYDALYKAADAAMYIAKSKGKNCWELYKK